MGKQKPEIPQGTLDLLVLKALSLGPMHGYGVGQRIGQFSEEMLKVEEGTLYPALYRIERRGWIASSWGVSENNRRRWEVRQRSGPGARIFRFSGPFPGRRPKG